MKLSLCCPLEINKNIFRTCLKSNYSISVCRDLCKNLLRQGLAGDLPLLVTDLEFLTSISAVSKTKRF